MLTVTGETPSPAGQLRRLAGRIARSADVTAVAAEVEQLAQAAGTDNVRVAIVGEVTAEYHTKAIRAAFAAEGRGVELFAAPYGTPHQQMRDPASGLVAFAPEWVFVVPEPELEFAITDLDAGTSMADEVVDRWVTSWRTLSLALPDARVIQHLYEQPQSAPLGRGELELPWSDYSLTRHVNDGLRKASGVDVRLVDLTDVVMRVGRRAWRDARLWNHGRIPFSPRELLTYYECVRATIADLMGTRRKALIVDLDNTLWGGVVGDDGVDGLVLGPNDPVGSAFSDFCSYVKTLGQRGVILGICSKNDPDVALRVFDEHLHMPLKRDDFAVIVCNWHDKAANLRTVAEHLNIGLEALVFVDDNPVECDLIREELPDVSVIQLPDDPGLFVEAVDARRYFESLTVTAADLQRSSSYGALQRARSERMGFTDLRAFLAGLDMNSRIWEATLADLVRLAQLEQKVNQFNVTSARLTASQINTNMADPSTDVLCFELTDKYGNHGLVSSVTVHYARDEAVVLSWLMSCRVFARTCEQAFVIELARRARFRGCRTIRATFRSNGRNSLAKEALQSLGFHSSDGNEFVLDLGNWAPPKTSVR